MCSYIISGKAHMSTHLASPVSVIMALAFCKPQRLGLYWEIPWPSNTSNSKPVHFSFLMALTTLVCTAEHSCSQPVSHYKHSCLCGELLLAWETSFCDLEAGFMLLMRLKTAFTIKVYDDSVCSVCAVGWINPLLSKTLIWSSVADCPTPCIHKLLCIHTPENLSVFIST